MVPSVAGLLSMRLPPHFAHLANLGRLAMFAEETLLEQVDRHMSQRFRRQLTLIEKFHPVLAECAMPKRVEPELAPVHMAARASGTFWH